MQWKTLLILLVVVLIGVSGDRPKDCGPCVKDDCPEEPTNCKAGIVLDRCGCCRSVCGHLEGERCTSSNQTLHPVEEEFYGYCGDNMDCHVRSDLEDLDINEAQCHCKKDGPVCGSDGRTYASVCRLRQESSGREEELTVTLWTPCETQPTISSLPENVTANVHDDLALSCEARGYPIPSLIWEFESAANGRRIKLPGDDQMIALQVRGGPEPYMVSSWIQILRVRSTDAGIYSCTVVSKKGIVRAEATVQVIKRTKTRTTTTTTTARPVISTVQQLPTSTPAPPFIPSSKASRRTSKSSRSRRTE